MTTKVGAILMAALLVLYVALVGWRAVQFIATGEPAAVGIGIALIVLPIIAVWALWRELAFGVRSQALVRRLETEGGLDLGSTDCGCAGHGSDAPPRDARARALHLQVLAERQIDRGPATAGFRSVRSPRHPHPSAGSSDACSIRVRRSLTG